MSRDISASQQVRESVEPRLQLGTTQAGVRAQAMVNTVRWKSKPDWPVIDLSDLCWPQLWPLIFRQHVLPPTSICPTVLDRQRSTMRPSSRTAEPKRSEAGVDIGPGSFQISPEADCEPLLVFVNPKSGGRQVSSEPEMRVSLMNYSQLEFNLVQFN